MTSEIIAETNSGKVTGTLSGGVRIWKGIPFAAPPVSALRWRAPQPPAPWAGLRQATDYGNDCMQIPVATDAAPLGATPDEDCLYLNVWSPEGSGDLRPVMVWIHGGGFVNGGSSPSTYAGDRLARKGVVVVSFNYRLGRFGFFAHPALTAENADDGLLGNYGILDQIAALRWVRDNIAAFGGDPERITLVGESAGGSSVHMLLTSPLARNMVQGAVIMSGLNGKRPGSASLKDIEDLGITFAGQHGISPEDPEALTKLRALPASAIAGDLNMTNMNSHRPLTYAGPFVDGRIVGDVGKVYAGAEVKPIPMMIGATDDDLDGRTGFMIGGARHITRKLTARGFPVYAYRFGYVASSLKQPGAKHATEIPFFLDTQDIKYGDQTSTRDAAVGELLSTTLANFVTSGDPNCPGIPEWPVYENEADAIMFVSPEGEANAQRDPWGPEIAAAPEPTYPDSLSRH